MAQDNNSLNTAKAFVTVLRTAKAEKQAELSLREKHAGTYLLGKDENTLILARVTPSGEDITKGTPLNQGLKARVTVIEITKGKRESLYAGTGTYRHNGKEAFSFVSGNVPSNARETLRKVLGLHAAWQAKGKETGYNAMLVTKNQELYNSLMANDSAINWEDYAVSIDELAQEEMA